GDLPSLPWLGPALSWYLVCSILRVVRVGLWVSRSPANVDVRTGLTKRVCRCRLFFTPAPVPERRAERSQESRHAATPGQPARYCRIPAITGGSRPGGKGSTPIRPVSPA